MSIIIFLIILAVLVLVHEFGHFIVAKKSGIRVDEFGLGFPPKLYGKQWGSTLYTLNAIPFGGFVKIFGENAHDEVISEADKSTSFVYKSKWIQALVLVAGVTMNLIFAWLVISLGFMIGLPSPVEHTGFGQVSNAHLIVTEVLQGSPAEKAGLVSGDKLLSVTSGKISLQNDSLTPEKVHTLISDGITKKVDITYSRGSASPVSISVEPDMKTVTGTRAIGIAMDKFGILKLPIHLALVQGAYTTWLLTKGTVVGLGAFMWGIVKFKSDFSQVSGPIGIVKVVSQANALGFVYLLTLVSLISINLAVINLLPFPALDGGRLLFVAVEAITRRPIRPSIVRWTNTIGFVFLILLMILVTGHDIFNLL